MIAALTATTDYLDPTVTLIRLNAQFLETCYEAINSI